MTYQILMIDTIPAFLAWANSLPADLGVKFVL